MKVVYFDGIAAIPKGTEVELCIQESDSAAKALEIIDKDRGIRYTNTKHTTILLQSQAAEPGAYYAKGKMINVEVTFYGAPKSRLELDELMPV